MKVQEYQTNSSIRQDTGPSQKSLYETYSKKQSLKYKYKITKIKIQMYILINTILSLSSPTVYVMMEQCNEVYKQRQYRHQSPLTCSKLSSV